MFARKIGWKALLLLLGWPSLGHAQSFPGWSRTFDSCRTAVAVTATTDGHLVVVGVSEDRPPASVCVVKLTESGDVLWEKHLTDYAFATSVAPSRDGGVVLAGDNSVLLHLDSAGGVIGESVIPYSLTGSAYALVVQDIELASDGGFFAASHTWATTGYGQVGLVVRLDSLGTPQWTYNWGSGTFVHSVTPTSDGGVLATGVGYSIVHGNLWGDGSRQARRLGADGTPSWTQSLHSEPGFIAGGGADPSFQGVQMNDGSFFISEASYEYRFEPFGYVVSAILTRLASDGTPIFSGRMDGLGPMWSEPDTVLVTASTRAPGNELLIGGYMASNPIRDGFLARFDSEGVLIEELLIGDTAMQSRIDDILVTPTGRVVVAGSRGACNLDACGAMFVSAQGGILTNSDLVPKEPLSALTLSPNYPDPFRGATTIRFQLSEPAPVSVEVWDLLGRRTAVLMDEWRPAGESEVVWDARGVSSGLYVSRVVAGDRVAGELLVVSR